MSKIFSDSQGTTVVEDVERSQSHEKSEINTVEHAPQPRGPMSTPEQIAYEKDLVERVVRGDLSAATELFTEYCMPVFVGVIARSQQGNWISPEELCNDVYLHLAANEWEKLSHFQFRCGLKTWFWTISLHLIYRKFRREKKHIQNVVGFDFVENQLSSESDFAIESSEMLFRAGDHDDFTLEPMEIEDVVHQALALMKNPYYKDLIMHRGLMELSSVETARRLNHSPCAIDQGYCRAKRELRKIIVELRTGKEVT